MKGKIRRKLTRPPPETPTPRAAQCALCGREMPPGSADAHHLVPRTCGGRDTVMLHRICHRQIHALLSERVLAREYATIEALRAYPPLARFIAWVQARPPGFHERARRSLARR